MSVGSDNAVAADRSNPFCTRFVRPGAIRYLRFETETDTGWVDEHFLPKLVGRLVQHRNSLIVGPHGSGKSTLLQTLLPLLRAQFVDVGVAQTRSPEPGPLLARRAQARSNAELVNRQRDQLAPQGLLVVDGFEQLGALDRWRLLRLAKRHGQSILATSHREHRRFEVLHRTDVTPELIDRLTRGLLEGVPDAIAQRVLAELARRDLASLTDLRELWFELYDVAEDASAS